MQKQITINNENINYTIRQSTRSKRLRLIVYCGGELVVSAPGRLPFCEIENFMREKSRWIKRKITHMKKFNADSVLRRRSKKEYLARKGEAVILVKELIEKHNAVYNFPFNKITIRNQKTRWGSCSSSGNLNFNYKIIFLPRAHAEYIVVHELCHLKEFNHSKRFWTLVEKTLPSARKMAREVRLM